MRTLYLLRHAKSSWADPALGDHDRPLNARGLEACGRLAQYFRREGVAPELVLCSTAERTRATLHGIFPGLPVPLDVRYEPALYLAEARAILTQLQAVPATVGKVMVIGHNPGLEDFAALILADEKSDNPAWADEKFPTGGFAAFSLEIADWTGLAPGSGRLFLYAVPRTLPG